MTTDGPDESGGDPADVMVRAFETEARRHPGTHVELRRTGPREVGLDAVFQMANRGEGHASRMLGTLAGMADGQGVTLTLAAVPLHVAPTGGGPAMEPDLDLDALLAWYGRHGFVVDGEDRGCPTMRREPVTPTPTPAMGR